MTTIPIIEEYLCKVISSVIYPAGTSQASVGCDVRISRGWPQTSTLEAMVMSDTPSAWIAVNHRHGFTQDRTRFQRRWKAQSDQVDLGIIFHNDKAKSLLYILGNVLNDGVCGVIIDNISYPVVVSKGNSNLDVASAIYDAVSTAGFVQINCSGSVLSVVAPHVIDGRGEAYRTVSREILRTSEGYSVSIFAPSIQARDAIEEVVMNTISGQSVFFIENDTVGPAIFVSRELEDKGANANLYGLTLTWTIEAGLYEVQKTLSALWTVSVLNETYTIGDQSVVEPSVKPRLGAIRFDAWQNMSNAIDQQCAMALSGGKWNDRLPVNSQIGADKRVTWSTVTQDMMDEEIAAALRCGLSFWAFDSYDPNDQMSSALNLYLSSEKKDDLKFCMIGQSSNWSDTENKDGYSAALLRDIDLMGHEDWLRVQDQRPVYFVLDATDKQISSLPEGMYGAITYIRENVKKETGYNPYIVYMSSSSFQDYDNTIMAASIGADAASEYCCPRLNGTPQAYSSLASDTEADWTLRLEKGFPMIPTAMSGWDQRPLIENPQEFYPLSDNVNDQNYYEAADQAQIAHHVSNMMDFISNNISQTTGIGLIYAWNEFAEGGWIAPTFSQEGGDFSRIDAIGTVIQSPQKKSLYPNTDYIYRR